MFHQTAPPQMNDAGNNSNNNFVGNQNGPQMVQPVDKSVDQVANQLTDQNFDQTNPPWQPMPSQDAPPSGMTRVPMSDEFSMPPASDLPGDQASNQLNDTPRIIESSDSINMNTDSVSGAFPPVTSDSSPAPTSEKLEDQNIFYMLGVTDGTEEQKNQFLDELQQVIWEDFLDEDVKLLLTQEEQVELDKLKVAKPDAKLEEQEEVIVYLEKLIPDLEDILLEKALELKADLMKERVAGMRELYKDKPEHLTKIDEAERMMGEEKWLSAAQVLNSITTT